MMSGIRRELSARGLVIDALIALGLTALSLLALAFGARDSWLLTVVALVAFSIRRMERMEL